MSPVALILIGQPSLRNQLKVRHLDTIDQRIQTRYLFQGFAEQETRSYIQHQVKNAGSEQKIFERKHYWLFINLAMVSQKRLTRSTVNSC